MEANELMVGDWVRHKKLEKNFRIVGISTENGYIQMDCSYMWAHDSCFEPIPLTDGILERNAFERSKYNLPDFNIYLFDGFDSVSKIYVSVRFQKNGVTIIECCRGGLKNSPFIKFGKYNLSVHDLQHAIRLCGIEKEIEL